MFDDEDQIREALRYKDSEILLVSEPIPEGALVARPIIGYLVLYSTGETMIGWAARDIRQGEEIIYAPGQNTADILARVG